MNTLEAAWILAGRQGFEPRYADPESAVLPLDDLPVRLLIHVIGQAHACQGFSFKLLDAHCPARGRVLRIIGS